MQVIRSKLLLKAFICHRVLAGVEHRHILEKNLQNVVDIGANRGQFTLAVRRWAPNAMVIAFEPIAEAAAKFRKVFLGDSKVTIYQVAIGPEAGEANINIAAKDDSSSFLPISSIQEKLFPGTYKIRTETVKIGRLNDYITADAIVDPSMLKLDVQGYELAALRGCEKLLSRFFYLYVECSFIELYSGQALVHEIVHWLGERGWCLSGIYNLIYDCKGKSVQADFLFENSCFARDV